MSDEEMNQEQEVPFNNARVSVIAFVVNKGKLLVGSKTENHIFYHDLPVCRDTRHGETFTSMAIRAAFDCAGVVCTVGPVPVIWTEHDFSCGDFDVAICVICHPDDNACQKMDFYGSKVNGVDWAWVDAVDAIPKDGWVMYRNIRANNPDIGRILALTSPSPALAVILDTGKSTSDPSNVRLMVQT
jgi:hypothetical protein